MRFWVIKKPKLSELGSFSVWESSWKLRGKGKEKLEFFMWFTLNF